MTLDARRDAWLAMELLCVLVHIGAVDSCTLQCGCLLAFWHQALQLGGAPIVLGDCIGKCGRPALLESHTHARRVRIRLGTC